MLDSNYLIYGGIKLSPLIDIKYENHINDRKAAYKGPSR